MYLRKELTPQRDQRINDTRVHCVLYFIAPTGHALSPLDISVMKKIAKVANLVPVIAKSDSLTKEEQVQFKARISEELAFHAIRVFPYTDFDQEFAIAGSVEERESRQAFEKLKV